MMVWGKSIGRVVILLLHRSFVVLLGVWVMAKPYPVTL